jgi:asparagine synthase (glutamine-hydrolysing)
MLDHFVGRYQLSRHFEQPLPEFEFDSARFGLVLEKNGSDQHGLNIFASRMSVAQHEATDTREGGLRVVATAGCLGLAENLAWGDDETPILLPMNNQQLHGALSKANGTFALASLDSDGALLLATDSLGARPLYYAVHVDMLYFSTSFELIVEIYPGTHALNRQALAEQISFCYPLGSRTLSLAVSVLRDGECLIASENGYRVERYLDWRQTASVDRSPAEELNVCVEAFSQAIRSRIDRHSQQLILLSGGLDSRMVAAALREEKQEVVAANCAITDTLDEHLCADFSLQAGVTLRCLPWTPDLLGVNAAKTTSGMLRRASSILGAGLVFSGDGGGELFGFHEISKHLLAIINDQGLGPAITYYAKKVTVSRRVVERGLAEEFDALAIAGMKEQFDEMPHVVPEKAMQYFLILNDLRCHLHDYFCSLESEVKELKLPFYDRRVLRSVFEIAPPFERCIGHRFYYKLLPLVSPLITRVPWQAYPESLPCPIPIVNKGLTQWKAIRRIEKNRAPDWRNRALKLIFKSNQNGMFRLQYIVLAAVLDIFSIRNYSYIFKEYLALQDAIRSLNKKGTL